MSELVTFAVSLALTLVLEFLFALVFRMRGKDFLLFVLVNILTNPAAVYLNLVFCTLFPDASVYLWQIPIEFGVVAAEGALYCYLSHSLRKPLLFALTANAFSDIMGIILNYII